MEELGNRVITWKATEIFWDNFWVWLKSYVLETQNHQRVNIRNLHLTIQSHINIHSKLKTIRKSNSEFSICWVSIYRSGTQNNQRLERSQGYDRQKKYENKTCLFLERAMLSQQERNVSTERCVEQAGDRRAPFQGTSSAILPQRDNSNTSWLMVASWLEPWEVAFWQPSRLSG